MNRGFTLMRHVLPFTLCFASFVMGSSQRAIPLTQKAREQIQSMRDSMPEDWTYLGMIRPKSTREIGYSLLGIGGEVLDRDFADFHAYQGYLTQEQKLHWVDGISFHGYPVNPDDHFNHVARIRDLVDRFAPGVVLWQGETGAPSARQRRSWSRTVR